LAPWEGSVTRCDDVGMSAGGEAALGMGKGGDNTSWANVNLTGQKNKKNNTVDSAATNG
jgi:hypothetical protein